MSDLLFRLDFVQAFVDGGFDSLPHRVVDFFTHQVGFVVCQLYQSVLVVLKSQKKLSEIEQKVIFSCVNNYKLNNRLALAHVVDSWVVETIGRQFL